MNTEKPAYIKSLFDLMALVSSVDTVASFDTAYNAGAIRYGDMKKQLAEDMVAFVAPIRERAAELQRDEDSLRRILKRGAEKARESASKTIAMARQGIGINYY
jgi:tryptophanyl-tRNA synthetase